MGNSQETDEKILMSLVISKLEDILLSTYRNLQKRNFFFSESRDRFCVRLMEEGDIWVGLIGFPRRETEREVGQGHMAGAPSMRFSRMVKSQVSWVNWKESGR